MFMQSVQGDAERWIAAVGVSRVHNTHTHAHTQKKVHKPLSDRQTDSRTDRAQTQGAHAEIKILKVFGTYLLKRRVFGF